MKIASYPHFGESRRMLFEYDRNACLELQLIVQGLISQCGRLYDLLVKNLDMVLKAKEVCSQQARSSKPKGGDKGGGRGASQGEDEDESTSSPPSNNIYS